MKIDVKEEDRTCVRVNNVVIDIATGGSNNRVFIDVYPYDHKKHALWFLNDEHGKNVYYKEYYGKGFVEKETQPIHVKDTLITK